MNLHWKRNGFRLQYQVVLSISCDVEPLTESERSLVKDAIRLKVNGPSLRVIRVNAGSRWVEMIVDADPGVDPTRKVGGIKADISAQVGALRGDDKPLWVPQYVIVTLGSLVDAQDTARELEQRVTAGSKGKGKK
jgi:hypothetical protein